MAYRTCDQVAAAMTLPTRLQQLMLISAEVCGHWLTANLNPRCCDDMLGPTGARRNNARLSSGYQVGA
jgi:hypothetical protein